MAAPLRFGIAGGGIVGSCVALFLKQRGDLRCEVTVFEPDPSYDKSATFRSGASVRQHFNNAVNIEMSRFGHACFAHAQEWLGLSGGPADLGWTDLGYLVLVGESDAAGLAASVELQHRLDVAAEQLDPASLGERFSWLNTEAIGAARLGGLGEGHFDPRAALTALRAKAEGLGAAYRTVAVTGIDSSGGVLRGVRLSDGGAFALDRLVIAAGSQAGQVAGLAGLDLPVHSRKRCGYVLGDVPLLPDFPILVDLTVANRGVFIRRYAESYMCLSSPDPGNDPDCDDFEVDRRIFDDIIRPALAARIAGFEQASLARAWAGHYEMNDFDQNAIIGAHPDLAGLYLAAGFSGHGVMHAPAAGRGLAELIATGGYETIDLSPFSIERIARGEAIYDPQASEQRADHRPS